MKSGTIKLIYDETVLKQILYYSVKDRNETILKWRQQTGLRLDVCVIHIVPNISKTVK